MRMVCSNGLVVPVFTGQIYNLHTSTAAGIFVNKLLSLSFLTGMKEMQAFLTKAADKTVSPELLENIVPHFGKKELEEWNGYPDHSAGGVINFLSYQQTHVATIAAESKYQGWINQIVREAA